ncbi:MAG: SGNH/GDSL hydrolase family protein [Planctomycetaceae bacterium]|jgi:hypothetical protein|nr:SGNH/GDSL hydrolase family protein [Planctomycetaceae bacterium]MBT6155491.1 SGNH/GDSL hydrolase family protein [Planctomycetaceae bacterium]MBT6485787.1 SGNH/GDSL hydrolase family protein [Planctomycetaceae bacterium]MBT6496253.1 SGNH/GDSL hydrolase family protein [Planctomycetaceae bacterium]
MNAVSPQKTRLKKAAGRVMLVCGGLLAGLLVGECALRMVSFSEPQIYARDQFVGTRLKADFEGIWTKEGQAHFRINNAGFRDVDRSHAKPEGTFRIAVLGDSYVEALQVPLEKAFWSVLETELANCSLSGQKKVEVMGFGVSGFGTGQQLLMLRQYVWDYDPDMVILLMCPRNDLADNSRQLTSNVVRPFFSLKDNQLELDNSFRQHPSYIHAGKASTRFKVACINRSRVLQLYSRIRNEAGSDDAESTSQADAANMCYVEPETAAWRDAWNLTERLVVEIQKGVQQRDVQFLLVTASSEIQVDPRQSVREEFRKQLGVADLFYFERRIEALATRNRITAICLGEPMAQVAQKENSFLHGFPNTAKGRGHWNADGHRLAAKLITEKLCGGFQRPSTPDESLR